SSSWLFQLCGGRGLEARLLNALDEDVLELGLRLDRRRKRDPAEIRVLDVFQRAVEDLFATEKERDDAAHPLGLLEDVRREDDRLALPLELRQEVLDEDDVDRVKAGERLVEDEHLRIVHDRAEELHLLLHALAQLLGLLLEPRTKVHRVDPRREALHRGLTVHALDRREKQELVDDLHLPVEAALLGQVADAFLQPVVHLLAEHADLARVRLRDVHDHADRGRLPGAVRPEETERGAVRDLEVEVVDGGELAEALHDTPERDRGRHAAFPPRAFLGGIYGLAGTKLRRGGTRSVNRPRMQGLAPPAGFRYGPRSARFSRAPIAQLDQSV